METDILPAAVVCHDAGGAEILSSYVRQQGLACSYALAGPALKIFERKLGALHLRPLAEAIQSSNWLLCGTSWQSELEWDAIQIAREMGKKTVAFLDHWRNYHERFIRGGEEHLPDEIWVGDGLAESIARQIFPKVKICLVENPYFNDLKRELGQLSHPRERIACNLKVLYVCEPVREHSLRAYGHERHWGYTEEDALRYFLSNISPAIGPVERIVMRPHPSEPPAKYDWAKREFSLPIESGGGKTLLEDIVECDVVVGCQSVAMVVGLLAGRRVISCVPPGGKPCGLPQSEIESLHDLMSLSARNSQ